MKEDVHSNLLQTSPSNEGVIISDSSQSINSYKNTKGSLQPLEKLKEDLNCESHVVFYSKNQQNNTNSNNQIDSNKQKKVIKLGQDIKVTKAKSNGEVEEDEFYTETMKQYMNISDSTKSSNNAKGATKNIPKNIPKNISKNNTNYKKLKNCQNKKPSSETAKFRISSPNNYHSDNFIKSAKVFNGNKKVILNNNHPFDDNDDIIMVYNTEERRTADVSLFPKEGLKELTKIIERENAMRKENSLKRDITQRRHIKKMKLKYPQKNNIVKGGIDDYDYDYETRDFKCGCIGTNDNEGCKIF